MYDLRDSSYVPPHLRVAAEPVAAQPERQLTPNELYTEQLRRQNEELVERGTAMGLYGGGGAGAAGGNSGAGGADGGPVAGGAGVGAAAVRRGEGAAWEGGASRLGAPEKYPFRGMAVGDTFVVPAEAQRCSWTSFRVMCSAKGRQMGRRYRCRRNPDDSYEVYRES